MSDLYLNYFTQKYVVIGSKHAIHTIEVRHILFGCETHFEEMRHSLDVWHKAKSIKNCLDKVILH